MPTNIYGTNDNFDKFNGHVIPAMISKFLSAKRKKLRSINLLGTGKPIREFLHASDLAKSIIMSLKFPKKKLSKICGGGMPVFNVGSGESVTIKQLSKIISNIVGFKGRIVFNKNYPDGTLKKNLDSSRIRRLGWRPIIKLRDGINKVISHKV